MPKALLDLLDTLENRADVLAAWFDYFSRL